MRHTFQSFWIGDTLSPYEGLALRSFIDHGHRVQLYCYTSRLNAPRGVELRDASVVLPKERCFSYKAGFGAGSFSACSNLFRYLLLRRYGGWWIDTDVICLTDRIPEFESFFALEDRDFINGAVLHFDASDPLLDHCLRETLQAGRDVSWGQIGPRLLTRKAKELGRFDEARRASDCYPLHWSAALELLDPQRKRALKRCTRRSLMVHLWNEVLRQADICKALLPPRGSYLRTLADRHPVDGWTGQYVVQERRAGAAIPDGLQHGALPLRYAARYWMADKMRGRSRPGREFTVGAPAWRGAPAEPLRSGMRTH